MSGLSSRDKLVRMMEAVVLAMFFGFAPPLFFLLTTVIFTAIAFGTKVLGPWALSGLVPGIVVDLFFLKRWVGNAYSLSNGLLAGFYIFYSVGVLGFCMGIPLLNLGLGVLAGAYTARRLQLAGADVDSRNREFERTSGFTAGVMVAMCCLITLWAIAGEVPGSQFRTTLLSFTFSGPVFWAVVFIGGTVLILLQYWLTLASAKLAYRVFSATRRT